jgi:cyanate permease
VWLVYLSFGLTISALAPLVAPIMSEFGISHTQMGGVLGAWQLVYFFAAVPCGLLVDRIGPKWALFAAALVMAATGLARSLAPDATSLALAVAIFGLGGPMVASGAPKMIGRWFTGPERGLAMGIYVTGPAVAGIATFAGTNAVLMPLFGDDWRQVLLLWAAVSLFAGISWLTLSAFVERAPSQQNAAPTVSGPGVFRALLGDHSVRLLLLVGFSIFTFIHGITHWLPEMLRAGGMDAIEAGYWAAFPTVVGVFGALVIPRFATPERRLWLLIVLACAAIGAAACLNAEKGPVLAFGLVLQGIARSSMMTVAILTLIELPAVGQARAGTATGLFFAAEGIGGMIGPLAVGALYDLTDGYAAGLVALMLAPATVALVAASLKLRSRSTI